MTVIANENKNTVSRAIPNNSPFETWWGAISTGAPASGVEFGLSAISSVCWGAFDEIIGVIKSRVHIPPPHSNELSGIVASFLEHGPGLAYC